MPNSLLGGSDLIFISPETTRLGYRPAPRHWVPILVGLYDIHGLHWDTTRVKHFILMLKYYIKTIKFYHYVLGFTEL